MNAPLHNNDNGGSNNGSPSTPELPRVSSASWDRWQNVRTPETVDEARAAIALATLKAEALERAAERELASPEPDRERVEGLRIAAGRWRDHLVGMEWALQVLIAGESPLRRQLADLQARYSDLRAIASPCPDAGALIALLQRRLQRNDEARADLAHELVLLESRCDRLREQLADAERQLSAKRAQVAELNRRLNGGDRG